MEAVAVTENTPEAVREAAGKDPRAEFEKRRKAARPAPATAPAGESPSPEADAGAQAPAEGEKDQRIAGLERKIADLKKRADDDAGRAGGHVQSLKSQIVDLQQMLTETRGELMSLKAAKVEPDVNGKPWLVGVTKDDEERYGEDFFRKLWEMNQRSADSMRREFKADPEKANERINLLERRLVNQRFWLEVDRLSPGALEDNGDPFDATVPVSPAWLEFLKQWADAERIDTNRDKAEKAVRTNNTVGMAALHQRFLRSQEKVERAQRTEDKPRVVPRSSGGMAPPESGKRRIPRSEIAAWEKRMATAKPGEVPFAEVDKKSREYFEATREGRVDYDV